MPQTPEGRTSYDDPRRLREILTRASDLASEHELTCVLVGLAGFEGDLLFPEVLNFVESALRVDDSVFHNFRESFPTATEPSVACGYLEISSPCPELTTKRVLPRIFAAPPPSH